MTFCLLCCVCVGGLDGNRKPDAALSGHDPRTAVQLRTALKRLKEIMEGKSQVLSACEVVCDFLVFLAKIF